ncbi:MAG: diphosphomevalonate/mevalonate 3,5-bisphosphate decarboxylase family protein [Saprospiraceae bacterium]
MTYENPNLVLSTTFDKSEKITCKSPSNIAIVKYWGKFGRQLPRNPSISLTLDNAFTKTEMTYSPKENKDNNISLNFRFEGKENEAFRSKMMKFLESITDIFPFLNQLHFEIDSMNSFPHSSGIASSASSMSALAMCLCELENRLFRTLSNKNELLRKASFVSRLGSGSACRSLYPVAGMWGELASEKDASNLYAIPFEQRLHNVFHSFHDDILIVSKGEKAVSSRAGHALMEGNIYAQNRYEQARNRTQDLIQAFEKGDVEHFGKIAENDALTLHALMMCSEPSYMLMRPNSLLMIEKVRAFRHETKLPLYFTLDAGPNLHLLYPDEFVEPIQGFIKSDLVPLCQDKMWIADKVGQGTVII